jgi:hypothetical protein
LLFIEHLRPRLRKGINDASHPGRLTALHLGDRRAMWEFSDFPAKSTGPSFPKSSRVPWFIHETVRMHPAQFSGAWSLLSLMNDRISRSQQGQTQMQQVLIPTAEEIRLMARACCQSERMRLKNEISFARGNALWGGPSSEETITALKTAVDAIDRRLNELTSPDHVSV